MCECALAKRNAKDDQGKCAGLNIAQDNKKGNLVIVFNFIGALGCVPPTVWILQLTL